MTIDCGACHRTCFTHICCCYVVCFNNAVNTQISVKYNVLPSLMPAWITCFFNLTSMILCDRRLHISMSNFIRSWIENWVLKGQRLWININIRGIKRFCYINFGTQIPTTSAIMPEKGNENQWKDASERDHWEANKNISGYIASDAE